MLEGHSGGRVVLILGTHLVIVDSRFCVGGHRQNSWLPSVNTGVALVEDWLLITSCVHILCSYQFMSNILLFVYSIFSHKVLPSVSTQKSL